MHFPSCSFFVPQCEEELKGCKECSGVEAKVVDLADSQVYACRQAWASCCCVRGGQAVVAAVQCGRGCARILGAAPLGLSQPQEAASGLRCRVACFLPHPNSYHSPHARSLLHHHDPPTWPSTPPTHPPTQSHLTIVQAVARYADEVAGKNVDILIN